MGMETPSRKPNSLASAMIRQDGEPFSVGISHQTLGLTADRK